MSDRFTYDIIRKIVGRAFQMVGFERTQSSVIQLMTDVTEEYIKQVILVSGGLAYLRNETELSLDHLLYGFQRMGIQLESLKEHINMLVDSNAVVVVPEYPVKRNYRDNQIIPEDPQPGPSSRCNSLLPSLEIPIGVTLPPKKRGRKDEGQQAEEALQNVSPKETVEETTFNRNNTGNDLCDGNEHEVTTEKTIKVRKLQAVAGKGDIAVPSSDVHQPQHTSMMMTRGRKNQILKDNGDALEASSNVHQTRGTPNIVTNRRKKHKPGNDGTAVNSASELYQPQGVTMMVTRGRKHQRARNDGNAIEAGFNVHQPQGTSMIPTKRTTKHKPRHDGRTAASAVNHQTVETGSNVHQNQGTLIVTRAKNDARPVYDGDSAKAKGRNKRKPGDSRKAAESSSLMMTGAREKAKPGGDKIPAKTPDHDTIKMSRGRKTLRATDGGSTQETTSHVHQSQSNTMVVTRGRKIMRSEVNEGAAEARTYAHLLKGTRKGRKTQRPAVGNKKKKGK